MDTTSWIEIKLALLLVCFCTMTSTAQVVDTIPVYEEEVPAEYLAEDYIQRSPTKVEGCYFYTEGSDRQSYGLQCGGEQLLPAIFRIVAGRYEHRVIFQLGEDTGIYDLHTHKWILPLTTGWIDSPTKGYYVKRRPHNGDLLIDSSGAVLLDLSKGDKLFRSGQKGTVLKIVKERDGISRKGLYDINAKAVTLDVKYRYLERISGVDHYVCSVDMELYQIFDGNRLMRPQYDYLQPTTYQDGAIIAKKDNKYGVINSGGRLLVPYEYKSIVEAEVHAKACFIVESQSEKFDIVDGDGQRQTSRSYDKITKELEGLFKIKVDGKYELHRIDHTGDITVVPACDSIDVSYLRVIMVRDGRWRITNTRHMDNIANLVAYSSIKQLDSRYIGVTSDSLHIITRNDFTVKARLPYVGIEKVPKLHSSSPYVPMYMVESKTGDHLLLNNELGEMYNFDSSQVMGYCRNQLYFRDEDGLVGIYDLEQQRVVSVPMFDSVHVDADRTILSASGQYYELNGNTLLRL